VLLLTARNKWTLRVSASAVEYKSGSRYYYHWALRIERDKKEYAMKVLKAVRALERGLKYGCWHEMKNEHNKQHGWEVLR